MNASDHDRGAATNVYNFACDSAPLDAPVDAPAAPQLSPELDAFLLDRFSTTLEDPHTGRKLKP